MDKKYLQSQAEEQEEIQKLIQKAKDNKARAKVELKTLNETLSSLLADHALGRIPNPEIAMAKKRRDKLHEIISDAPLLLKGLKRLRVKSS